MARAVEHHIEFTLEDYHHHIRMVLGCGINAATREAERRIATGQALLICQEFDADDNPKGDAYVVNRRHFSTKYNLKFDRYDRLWVVPRTLKFTFGSIKFDPSDPGGPVVEQIGGLPDWMYDFVYTVVEQEVSSSPAPAALPAPDEKPDDKTGPDPFRTGAAGRPSAAHLIRDEARRRISAKKVTPREGGLADFSKGLANWWDENRKTFEPHGPELTAGSIENIVRDLWRAALGAKPTK
jgi:hypothetical protein